MPLELCHIAKGQRRLKLSPDEQVKHLAFQGSADDAQGNVEQSGRTGLPYPPPIGPASCFKAPLPWVAVQGTLT